MTAPGAVRVFLKGIAAAMIACGAAASAADPAATPDRELAPDDRAIGFATAAEVVRSLQQDPDVHIVGTTHPISSTERVTSFFNPSERQMWQVRQSDNGRSDAGRGRLSAISMRFVARGRTTRELYAHLCDGDVAWCASILAGYLQAMQDYPPPVPPLPRARPGAASGG